MTTACYTHPACIAHDPGVEHSERSPRLQEILHTLHAPAFAALQWPEVPQGHRDDIERVHGRAYVDFVFASVPAQGYKEIEINDIVSEFDGGEVTVLCPQSGEAVLRATGAVTSAVDDVMAGRITNAFCAVRPPGHHALADKAMGFCVFNNAAVAARYAQSHKGARRVAIVDFDLHHGNGTQAIFENDPSVFYCSTHQLPLWPETGAANETGAGNIFNVPLPPYTPRAEWLAIWETKVLPRLEAEDFDLLIISAGFDAHKDDPKGEQSLETEDYTRLTKDLMAVAARKCGGKVVAILEGGYDINASAASAGACVQALMSA